MKSKFRPIVCLILIAIILATNIFADSESPFSIDSSSESIPLCKYIEDENFLIKFPGTVVGIAYLYCSGLIYFPLIIPSFGIGGILEVISGGKIDGGSFSFGVMACVCYCPAVAIGTAVSTPFYIIKKSFYDFPKFLIRKVKNG